jgi:membrane associated rhomboid family serine protease
VFPLRDINPSRRVPAVTLILVAVNVAVFLLEISLPPERLTVAMNTYGIVPARYFGEGPAAGPSLLLPLPLLTSMFLHAGWIHLLSNLWILWIFGDNVEDRLGHFRFLVFYLGSGVAAGLVHLFTNTGSSLPTIGASGAIAGVMGAYFLLFPRARVLAVIPIFFWPFFLEVPAVVFMAVWFLGQFLSGLLSLGETGGGIAWWAHVGGFIAGVVLCPVFVKRRRRF